MIPNVSDTIVQINEFDPVTPYWYWAKIEDIHGYYSISDGFYVLDEHPTEVTINPIVFSDSLFSISWSGNSESDFESYMLFESNFSDMSSAVKIFETNDINTRIFDHYQIEQSQYK